MKCRIYQQTQTRRDTEIKERGTKNAVMELHSAPPRLPRRGEEEEEDKRRKRLQEASLTVNNNQPASRSVTKTNGTDKRKEEHEAFECSGEDGKYHHFDRDRKREVKHCLSSSNHNAPTETRGDM